MATILDGKALSAQCKEEIRKEAEALAEKGCRPGMAVVLVGENPASKVYVRNKEKDCQECGIYSAMYHLPEETSEKELLELLDTLNHDSSIHGILCSCRYPSRSTPRRLSRPLTLPRTWMRSIPPTWAISRRACPGLHPAPRRASSG